MKYRPINDRILLLQDAAEKETEGGIIRSEAHVKKPNRGFVVAVGPGVGDMKMSVTPGERILFDENTGTEMDVDGKIYLMIRNDNILLIEDPEESEATPNPTTDAPNAE